MPITPNIRLNEKSIFVTSLPPTCEIRRPLSPIHTEHLHHFRNIFANGCLIRPIDGVNAIKSSRTSAIGETSSIFAIDPLRNEIYGGSPAIFAVCCQYDPRLSPTCLPAACGIPDHPFFPTPAYCLVRIGKYQRNPACAMLRLECHRRCMILS